MYGSNILDGGRERDIGLSEVGFVDGLLSFRMGTIFASFHDVGILLCVIKKLHMSVRALMVCVYKCFWRKFKMLSRPVENAVFCLSYRRLH